MESKGELNFTILRTEIGDLKENIDEIYLLTNATFVCLMQCGFACLEAGSIRSKNVTNIMMKNILDVFISCLAFWIMGYAIAYGNGNGFMGLSYWAAVNVPAEKFAHWFFQFVFAATAATLVSGAVAERCNFVAYLIYSTLISGFIYPTVAHWVWSPKGWLSVLGYSDFAGCGPVHVLGGMCSLVAAALLGPRIGRFDGVEMPGHSVPLVGIGGMILITGFLAFNGGSLGTMTTTHAGATISIVTANTVMAGTGGALFAIAASKLSLTESKAWSFILTLNASFAGMVAVCAAANSLVLWSSFTIGIVAGLVHTVFHRLLVYFKVDDPLDAVAVHLGGGIWGVIAGPIFKTNGILFGVNKKNSMLLVYNITGALSIILWSFTTSVIMFGLLRYFKLLRVSEQEELLGLDITKHKEPAYPIAGWSAANSGRNHWYPQLAYYKKAQCTRSSRHAFVFEYLSGYFPATETNSNTALPKTRVHFPYIDNFDPREDSPELKQPQFYFQTRFCWARGLQSVQEVAHQELNVRSCKSKRRKKLFGWGLQIVPNGIWYDLYAILSIIALLYKKDCQGDTNYEVSEQLILRLYQKELDPEMHDTTLHCTDIV